MPNNRTDDLWEAVKTLQHAGGGGCAKVVQVAFLFDKNGRIVAKTEPKVTRLYPGDVVKFLEELTE